MFYIRTDSGLPGGSDCKKPASSTRDLGSIPGSGRSPGEGNGYPFQCSCLENPMDRGAWRATVRGVRYKSVTDIFTFFRSCEGSTEQFHIPHF